MGQIHVELRTVHTRRSAVLQRHAYVVQFNMCRAIRTLDVTVQVALYILKKQTASAQRSQRPHRCGKWSCWKRGQCTSSVLLNLVARQSLAESGYKRSMCAHTYQQMSKSTRMVVDADIMSMHKQWWMLAARNFLRERRVSNI